MTDEIEIKASPTFEEWLLIGIMGGYCTEPVCGMHDTFPMNEEETAQFEDGYDPCIPIVRLLTAR